MSGVLSNSIRRYFPNIDTEKLCRGAIDWERHRVDTLRNKTLIAAAAILKTHGQANLSLKDIARHANVGIASIYYYFQSKDDLLISLAMLGFEDLRRDMLQFQTVAEYGSPMTQVIQAHMIFIEDRPELLSLMFSERLMARSEALRNAEQAAFEVYRTAIEADELFDRPYRTSAARALWTLGRGIAGTAASHPDGRMPQEIYDSLIEGASYLISREVN